MGDRATATPRRWTGRAAAGLTSLLIAVGVTTTGVPASAADRSGPLVDVIVRTASAQDSSAAQAAVRQVGGTVGTRLEVISGFAARIPRSAVAVLRGTTGVAEVTATRRSG